MTWFKLIEVFNTGTTGKLKFKITTFMMDRAADSWPVLSKAVWNLPMLYRKSSFKNSDRSSVMKTNNSLGFLFLLLAALTIQITHRLFWKYPLVCHFYNVIKAGLSRWTLVQAQTHTIMWSCSLVICGRSSNHSRHFYDTDVSVRSICLLCVGLCKSKTSHCFQFWLLQENPFTMFCHHIMCNFLKLCLCMY